MSATTEAVAIIGVLLVLSLISAYITLILLKGTADVLRKGVRLGGASAMFVVTFVLLNHFLPDIRDGLIAEAAAAPQFIDLSNEYRDSEPVQLSVSPALQVTTKVDLNRLSKNDFVYNEEMEAAIARPQDNTWEVGVFEEGVQSIDLSQIPLFQLVMQTLASVSPASTEGTSVFGIRSRKSYDLVVNADSKIDGMILNLNPFEDAPFVKSTISAQLQASQQILPGDMPGVPSPEEATGMVELMMEMALPMMSKGYADLVERSFPKTFKIRSGVYLMSIGREVLEPEVEGFLAELQSNSTLLDRALEYLTVHMLVGGVATNVQVDQRKGIMSYDGTVQLENVVLDGKNANISIHHIGFVVTGVQRAVLVNLVYFDTGAEGISVLLKLQEFFNSLRFTT